MDEANHYRVRGYERLQLIGVFMDVFLYQIRLLRDENGLDNRPILWFRFRSFRHISIPRQ